MQSIIRKFKAKHKYTPTIYELYSLYQQGELVLSDREEDALIKEAERAELC